MKIYNENQKNNFMKKMVMILAVVLTTITTTAFAGEITVKEQVLSAFKSEYANAQEVSWSVSNEYYKASFTLNSQKVFAFYSLDGEFMALTRYISSVQLPVTLQANLKKNHSDKWISDLFEVSNSDGTSYYITLEDADSITVLRSSGDNVWKTYKRSSKA
jgi:hypothetical protein